MINNNDRVGRNIKIKSYDDIFDNGNDLIPETETADKKEVGTVYVGTFELNDFKDHPFKVEGKGIGELLESIREYGILSPIIVRPLKREEGGYEIISGHRRKYCAVALNIPTVPVIIRDIDDDEAVLVMVDSNIQREDILPSEKAFAYKMKNEAIKRQGKRSSLTSGQFVQKLNSSDEVGLQHNESGRQIRRYIRLTELSPHLLNAVDNKKMSVNSGVLLSYLNEDQMAAVEYAASKTRKFPNIAQAKRLRELVEENPSFTAEDVYEILIECKNQADSESDTINFSGSEIRTFFPQEYNDRQIEEAIIEILKNR